MGSWQQRSEYLVGVAQQCLQGRNRFDLCRSHLVKASQISRGTVYNHFPTEADLKLAVLSAELAHDLALAEKIQAQYPDPLHGFLIHHCYRLHQMICQLRFSFIRDLPDQAVLEQASADHREAYLDTKRRYEQWNKECVDAMGRVPGYDRAALVRNYIYGALMAAPEQHQQCGNAELYQQFCFAMAQLLGQSGKRLPSGPELLAAFAWLDGPSQR